MEKSRKLVNADCEQLLHRFKQTESVRFEVFSRIWREMKFSEIFYGLGATHKKRRFSRMILDSACSYFLPPFSFQIRVGGLYLLYSLYRCQTASPPEQIRLALKDWEDVKNFEKDSLEAKHLDVVYILHQLLFLKAFHFTAMPTALAFVRQKDTVKSQLCEGFMESASCPQQLISIDLLEELTNIHDLYGKLKTSASLTSGAEASSVNLIHKNLIPKLHNTVVDFYKWQQREFAFQVGADEEEDSREETSSHQECSERAERLAAIKSRAFGQAAEASKSRRHRQVEVDPTSNDAGPSTLSDHSKSRRPSLKVRTKKNLHIPGDLCKDATSFTNISRLTTVDFAPKERTKKKYSKFR